MRAKHVPMQSADHAEIITGILNLEGSTNNWQNNTVSWSWAYFSWFYRRL